MLAGWIASGRIRYSPELTHSRSIASARACDGKTPALGPASPACGDAPTALWTSLIQRRLFAAPPRCRGAG